MYIQYFVCSCRKLADAKVIPWPIAVANKASSEVQVLIQEELPEDSSDEEYNPEHDKQSDDDREVDSTTSSDIESQPSTPADILDITSTEQHESPHVQYDPEGIFKIPVYVKDLLILFDHKLKIYLINKYFIYLCVTVILF